MPKRIDKFTQYDIDTDYLLAMTLFNGYLKDKVSPEKKLELMKKLSLPFDIDHGFVEAVRQEYGDKFSEITKKAQDDSLDRVDRTEAMPGGGVWVQGGTDAHFEEPDMEDALAIFEDGLRETLEILDENEKDLDLKEPNARNHYNFLKTMLKDSYEGTLGKKISEDPAYGLAVAMTAKVGFETGTLQYNTKTKEYQYSTNGTPTQTVLKEMADTGILEAMTGGVRTHQKLQDHITTGNTSRQELLNEYEEQSRRYDKVMKLTDEKVKDLKKKNVLQNDRSELTDGPRGIIHAVENVKAKTELLNAGYPAEDIQVMSSVYLQYKWLQREINSRQKELDKKIQDNPNVEGAEKEARDKEKERIDKMTAAAGKLEQAWKEVTDPEKAPLTEEKRLENLGKLKSVEENIRGNAGKNLIALNQFSDRIDKRIAAPLNLGDKAMLANDYTAMYNALTDADPKTLFTGSGQFKELKNAMKELAEMDRKLSTEQKEMSMSYRDKKREVMEKAQKYLRYKERQMNGPDGHKHKRSQLEVKRVQAVDGLYNRLLADEKRRVPDLRLEESEKAIVPKVNDQELLTPEPKGEARDFNTYLKKHTGKGAMSGTNEELVNDASKVLAAQIMPKQKPPKEYDPKAIEKAAGQIKDKFDMEQMDEAELRDAMNDPKSIKVLAQQHHRKTYGVDPDYHEEYVTEMQKLYRDMEKPDGTNKEYQKIYDCVQKIAHLPYNPEAEGLSMNKVSKMVEQTNSEIYEAMDRYVDRYGKGIGPSDRKMLQVLNVMEDNVPGTQNRAEKMVARINNIKGVTKDITNAENIQLEMYGRKELYGLSKSKEKLKISKSIRSELYKGLEKDEREKLAQVKAQTLEAQKSKAKDAFDAVKGKKLEDVPVPEKKSKEVGDKAKKNSLKEKKEKSHSKFNDGIYL